MRALSLAIRTSRGTALCCALLALACKRAPTPSEQLEALNLTEEQAKQILSEMTARASGAPESSLVPREPAPSDSAEPSEPSEPSSTGAVLEQALDPALFNSDWVVDGLVDVAPAAPSTASERGVVLITGRNELLLARLGTLSRLPTPAETPIKPLQDSLGPFALGRGPSVADGYAYWVTSHFLLRRPLEAPFEPLEKLAADARVGTRAAALPGRGKDRPTWVAYVALPSVVDGPLRAKLWYGQQHEAILTDVASSALSVGLVEMPTGPLALMLEARTGQSTLHARSLSEGNPPKLAADRVVWVGGSPNPLTELRTLVDREGRLITLLAVDRDVTHFGLGVLSFGAGDVGAPQESWFDYQNGINPAPAAIATFCGKPHVVFARPSSAEPGAPQELVLVDSPAAQGTRPAVVLGTSKAYYDVSLAALPKGGALLSYVADHRTWARTIRCVKKAG